jgi:hypothetical protein
MGRGGDLRTRAAGWVRIALAWQDLDRHDPAIPIASMFSLGFARN